MTREPACLPGGDGKHSLRDILSQRGIAAGPSKGSKVDNIEVTPDEFSERGLGSGPGVLSQQLGIVDHGVIQ